MISSGFALAAGTGVRVRQGFRHATLGEIGGWEGKVMRSFSAGDVIYLDIEISPATIAKLGAQARENYYKSKIVFTRIRLRQRDVEEIPAAVPAASLEAARDKVQHEWFTDVGARTGDPTKELAVRAVGSTVNIGRRQAIMSLVVIGTLLISIMATMEQHCSSGSRGTGSWGRSGGFSS